MFSLLKSWDNRRSCDRKLCIKGRTWTRRIRWLEDSDGPVKLKLEDGSSFREVLTSDGLVEIIWTRFRNSDTIEEAIGLFGHLVPNHMKSKKGAENES